MHRPELFAKPEGVRPPDRTPRRRVIAVAGGAAWRRLGGHGNQGGGANGNPGAGGAALDVRSRSIATCTTVRSPTLQRRTASALNSGVNGRRALRCFFRLSMNHSGRVLAPVGVSTKAGEDHSCDPKQSAPGSDGYT